MALGGRASQAPRARVRHSWSTVRTCQPLIYPQRPGDRDPGTAVPAYPQASQLDAAIHGMQAVSYRACAHSAASDTAPQSARTLTGRRTCGCSVEQSWASCSTTSGVSMTAGMVLLLVACDDAARRGLPLAEQSARRYWRGVEGGSVLRNNLSCLTENIRHGSAKAKLIVFIVDSKIGNAWSVPRVWRTTNRANRAITSFTLVGRSCDCPCKP